MAGIASKNAYELLGNDPEFDSDKEPEPPVKVVDKTPARTDKRNAPREAPAAPAGANAGRRGNFTGNEQAFRDRNAGSNNNRTKPTDDGVRQDRHPRQAGEYSGRGRAGRGRGGARNFDRHSRTGVVDSEKQTAHGWGATEGKAELEDEVAGEKIAKADEKEALVEDGTDAPVNADGDKLEPLPAAEAEPEDNSISYADYLVQQAEKKAALAAGIPEPRKPNEGSKDDKKWANAKPIEKSAEESFIEGAGAKAKRERERKQKQVVEIDQRFVEQPDRGRGGFRGGRGDRPRGDGPRGDGQRGRGEGFRGGRGRGDGPRGGRGGPRGGPRGGAAAPIKIDDTNAFPSLGA